jgi:hypothetical protein
MYGARPAPTTRRRIVAGGSFSRRRAVTMDDILRRVTERTWAGILDSYTVQVFLNLGRW